MASGFRWVLSSVVLIVSLSANHASAQSTQKDEKKYEPLIVDFSDGHTLELVGMTYNTLQTNSGWRPDGSQMIGEGKWPSWYYYDGSHWQLNEKHGETPEPEPEYLDILLRFKGLKETPSIRFETPLDETVYYPQEVTTVYELRVSGKRREIIPGGIYLFTNDFMRIGFSDEPWGRWVKINLDGTIPDPIKQDELHESTYRLIEVLGIGTPIVSVPGVTPIKIRQPYGNKNPKDEWHQYEFEICAIERDGKSHHATPLLGGTSDNHSVTADYGLELPLAEGAKLSHFEYRVRPYKYWVTFEDVAMEPGKRTEPYLTGRIWP